MTALVPHRTRDLTTPPQDVLNVYDYAEVQVAASDAGIGRFVYFGLFVMFAFLGGSAYWGFASKLDGAVVAPASLVVEGNRKTVEHLDGGIVQEILVSNGDFVERGQVLLELDKTEIEVELTVLESQLGELTVRRARLLAQIGAEDSFTPEDASAAFRVSIPEAVWTDAYLTQRRIFDAERRERITEGEILEQRMTSLREQIAGLDEQRASNERQREITEEELGNLKILQAKGLVAAARVNGREVEIERLKGENASFQSQQAFASNQIGELQLTGLSQQKLRDETITLELAAVEAQIAQVEPQYSGATERLKRVTVIAPAKGRILGLTEFTTGGVIRPGAPILDIVPADEPLVVEARVNPADIEKLFVGQTSRIRLSAFDQTEVPEALGKIVDISADSLEDERSGETYYLARVVLDDEQPAAVANLDLVPGMPADLFVNTGERTAISFLTKPLSERLARTFIE